MVRVMRTDYAGHDVAYQRKRAAGELGWDNAKDLAEHVAALEKLFAIGHVRRAGKLLELGCGAGNVSLYLASQGFEVHGVDIAPTAIAWARERAAGAAEFHVADVLDLPGADFDIVVDGHCLHCIIGDDRARFLASARRALKPAGLLLVNSMCGEPTCESIRSQFDPETRCLVRGDLATRYLGTPEVILRELDEAGFEVTHAEVVAPADPESQTMLSLLAARR